MEGGLASILGISLMLLLLATGVPIAFTLAFIGIIGLTALLGWEEAFQYGTILSIRSVANYTLAALPAFLFFGYLAERTQLATGLYRAAAKWLRFLPGGLYAATIVSGGVFGAASGSSVASCALFSRLAVPEMRRIGYDKNLALGCVAAGGTLAPTIPPSIALVIYAVLTQSSILHLFAAAVIPGLIQLGLLVLTSSTLSGINPKLAPKVQPSSLREKFASLSGIWPILLVALAILGSIYGGIATVTEAASVGAIVGLVIVLVQRQLTKKIFKESLVQTTRISVMNFALLIGGALFSQFVTVAGLSKGIRDVILALPLSPTGIIIIIAFIYLVMGFFLDAMSILVITIPLLLPVFNTLGIDLIWFGVFATILIEIGTITPPMAINLFVVAQTADDASIGECVKGVLPFYIPLLILVGLLIVFPMLALWLPQLIK